MSLKKRKKHREKKARRLASAPPSLRPEDLKALLDAGNSETLTEFVGVRCLHNLRGGIMSLETYLEHLAAGCVPVRAAATYEDLTRRLDVREGVTAASLSVAEEIEGKEAAGQWEPKPKPPLGEIRRLED
jgi:hypothetical protein